MMSGKTSFITNELKKRKNPETPDFFDLKKDEDIIVFVYGTLRTGQRNFGLLENSKYLGEAATVTDNFCMFDSKWNFPVVSLWKKGDRGVPGFIYGELFAVSPLTVLELDRLEGNGVMYKREQKYFWAYDQKILGSEKTRHPSVKAWIYLSVPGYWSGEDLSLCPRFKPKGATKSYYDWTSTKEEDEKDERESEPEFGTPEYYDKYYSWHNGRYIQAAK